MGVYWAEGRWRSGTSRVLSTETTRSLSLPLLIPDLTPVVGAHWVREGSGAVRGRKQGSGKDLDGREVYERGSGRGRSLDPCEELPRTPGPLPFLSRFQYDLHLSPSPHPSGGVPNRTEDQSGRGTKSGGGGTDGRVESCRVRKGSEVFGVSRPVGRSPVAPGGVGGPNGDVEV